MFAYFLVFSFVFICARSCARMLSRWWKMLHSMSWKRSAYRGTPMKAFYWTSKGLSDIAYVRKHATFVLRWLLKIQSTNFIRLSYSRIFHFFSHNKNKYRLKNSSKLSTKAAPLVAITFNSNRIQLHWLDEAKAQKETRAKETANIVHRRCCRRPWKTT